MKRIPNGATVSRDELKVIAGAVDLAIDAVKMDMRSNTRLNRADHDDNYKLWLRAIKESLRAYENCARKLTKAMGL